MEIKYIETSETLRIEKKCKKEQIISRFLLIFSYIIYFIYEYENENINFFIIISTLVIYIAYRIITLRYMYEIIFIDKEQICFNTSYSTKILSKKEYQRKYYLKDLRLIYPWIFLKPRYFNGIKGENKYMYRVHFEFYGEENFYSWGIGIPIEDAGKVTERINNFLEKQKK